MNGRAAGKLDFINTKMKAASLNEIKRELVELDSKSMQEICMRLAKYKKENKELLTYLLFEAHDEDAYVSAVKSDMDELFHSLPTGNVYYVKKSLRKILRVINKQIKYSSNKKTELELRIHFCLKVKEHHVPLRSSAVLFNMHEQQVKKIKALLVLLPEDLQYDYKRELEEIGGT
jgi:hypothetical protein